MAWVGWLAGARKGATLPVNGYDAFMNLSSTHRGIYKKISDKKQDITPILLF
jgi:hypothetical protein